MKTYLFVIFILYHVALFSQEKTYGGSSENLIEKRGGLETMVIIPFEDKMYLSDVDAPIGRETGLNPGELMTKFRAALQESLEKELSKNWDIKYAGGQSEDNGVSLEFIHASIRYRYTPVPEEVKMANDTTIKKKDIRKSGKTETKKSGIEGGEVVTYSDETEKFMDVQITVDTLMQYLDKNEHAEFYLFISEFDIRHHITDPDKISEGGLSYRLKVHFSCVDRKGLKLVSGAVTAETPATTKNIYEIISNSIPELSVKLSKIIRKYAGG